MTGDEILCWHGTKDNDGWSFEMVLFRGELRGEVRFAYRGEPRFTAPIGENEIAIMRAMRFDLMASFLNKQLAAHEAAK